MNDTEKILPREKLVELFCTGENKWEKLIELNKMFESIDRLGDALLDLQTTSQGIKVTMIEMRLVAEQATRERDELKRDRDEWKKLAEVLGVHP